MSRRLHILAVDDEESLLKMLKAFLERVGHQVDPALRGDEALELYRSQPDQYDLVVLDLTMPDIPGEALLQEFFSIKPDSRVLVASGYPFDTETLPAAMQGKVAFLAKPFLPQMLLQCIQQLTP